MHQPVRPQTPTPSLQAASPTRPSSRASRATGPASAPSRTAIKALAVAGALVALAAFWAGRGPADLTRTVSDTGTDRAAGTDAGASGRAPAMAGAPAADAAPAGQALPAANPATGAPLAKAAEAMPAAAGNPPDILPSPIPLGRETRDPAGAARVAAQQAADHERQLADSAAPRPGQELSNARVLPADIGLPFMPNAVQDPAHSTRTAEPGQGRTVSTLLHASGSLSAATRYYRQALLQHLPRALLAEQQAGGGFTTLTATQSDTGTRVTVFLNASVPGSLDITLSRWDSRDSAAPVPSTTTPSTTTPSTTTPSTSTANTTGTGPAKGR